jgi:hypothetical protein
MNETEMQMKTEKDPKDLEKIKIRYLALKKSEQSEKRKNKTNHGHHHRAVKDESDRYELFRLYPDLNNNRELVELAQRKIE